MSPGEISAAIRAGAKLNVVDAISVDVTTAVAARTAEARAVAELLQDGGRKLAAISSGEDTDGPRADTAGGWIALGLIKLVRTKENIGGAGSAGGVHRLDQEVVVAVLVDITEIDNAVAKEILRFGSVEGQ